MKSKICPINCSGCPNDGKRQKCQMSHNSWDSSTQQTTALLSTNFTHHFTQRAMRNYQSQEHNSVSPINTKYLLQDTNFAETQPPCKSKERVTIVWNFPELFILDGTMTYLITAQMVVLGPRFCEPIFFSLCIHRVSKYESQYATPSWRLCLKIYILKHISF